ncbi:MAG: R3H domain-containing nucleic acid-binding protein [Cyanobacteria bacterium P01_H01_bin.15]
MAKLTATEGQAWLDRLTNLLGISVKASVLDSEQQPAQSEGFWLVMDGQALSSEQKAAVLGERGQTLDAIQYLANTVLNLGLSAEEQQPVTIELDDYRIQRYRELEAMATKAAEEVLATSQAVSMPPVSAAERRQLHTLLKEWPQLQTQSEGQEPERHLVVSMREAS